MRTHKTEGNTCPHCGYDLDAHTGLGHTSEPEVGDYTVCSKCFRILCFADDSILRKVSEMEMVNMAFVKPDLHASLRAAKDIAKEARKNITRDSN